MNGICIDTIFGPRPLWPWGGIKRSNIIKFQILSQSQIFLNQTLCVISQMKDIKHIRKGFSFSHLGHALGAGLREYRVVGVSKFIFFPKINQIWCVSDSHKDTCNGTIFFGLRPLGPCGVTKRSNIIKFHLLSQFQIFLNQTLCVFSQMKYIIHFRRDFY